MARVGKEKPTQQSDVPSDERAAAASSDVDRHPLNWIIQELHHLSKDTGRLTEAIDSLKETTKDTKKTVDWLKYIIAFAAGALVIVGYLFDKKFDQILSLLK